MKAGIAASVAFMVLVFQPNSATAQSGGLLEFGMNEFEAVRAVGPLRRPVRVGSVVEGMVRALAVGGLRFDRTLRFENDRLVRITMTRFDSRVSRAACRQQMVRASDAVARRRTEPGTDRYGNIRYSYSIGTGGTVSVQMGYVDVLRQMRDLWRREQPDTPFPHGQKGSCSMRITYDYRG